MSLAKKTWFITKAQIVSGDIDSAIFPVDPEQIPDAEIYGLHGMVRLRIQDAKGPSDVFGSPEARKYFQALHARWPYMGYFLRLAPITSKSPFAQICDLSTFMAVALCFCNDLVYCETKHGVGLQYNITELSKHLAEVQGRAAELADAIGIPAKEIEKRDDLISKAVASFFDAGRANFPQKNKRNNPR